MEIKIFSLAELNKISGQIVDAALEIHKTLGPGLLESVYETCLAHELMQRGLRIERQVPIPVVYKGVRLDVGFRIDILVEKCLVVELKATDQILPIHEAQILTYLKLTKNRIGLILNFNVVLMKNGTQRVMI